jgi:hypothetical protein
MSIAAVTTDVYRHFRWTWWGTCYQCKRKFIGRTTQRQDPDNVFSPLVRMPVCTCKGARYMGLKLVNGRFGP